MLFVRSLTNPKGGSRKTRGRASAYSAIHHLSSPSASWQAKTGDPYWMFTIRKQIEQKFNVRVRIHAQRFIKEMGGTDSPASKATKAKKANKRLDKNVGDEPGRAARWGAQQGKQRAPRDTGTLIRAIDWRQIKR